MAKGTGTQPCSGISISEITTQHFTGGKTHSPALQPLSVALLTTSATGRQISAFKNISKKFSSPAALEEGHALNTLSTHLM